MTDLCVCKKGVGFAVVTCLTATVGLTQTALGVGEDLPIGSGCAGINALPFADVGDTTGADCNGATISDSFDEVCPYSGSTSPEVFYNYLATAADDAADGNSDGLVSVDINTCESAYDTKLYVYDSGFTVLACVDDSCASSGGAQFRASINNVGLPVGGQYFIAVDGWAGASGVYDFLFGTTAGECVLQDLIDNETLPPCGLFETDEVAGDVPGSTPPCSTAVTGDTIADDPPALQNNDCDLTGESMTCNSVFCGNSGSWLGNPDCSVGGDADCTGDPGSCDLVTDTCVDDFFFRDLDWVPINVPVDVDSFVVSMTAEFTLNIFFLEPTPDCATLTQIFGILGAGECVTTTVTVTGLPAGDYYLLPTSNFGAGGAECGDRYLLQVTCALACPTDLDGDNQTGFTDLTTLLGNWGACPAVP